jgi:hypothetical protein
MRYARPTPDREPEAATTRVRLSDDAAWRLLFNALGERETRDAIVVEGRQDLAAPLRRARSVIV